MSETVTARTARKPHYCESCNWQSIGVGHRYLRHTVFPGHDVLTVEVPMALAECAACAIEREVTPAALDACEMFCCGDVPCARPYDHDGNHSCRGERRLEIHERLMMMTLGQVPNV